MTSSIAVAGRRLLSATLDLAPEVYQGLDNLRSHKLRSLLTMLGMIFGVAAVVAMLSIGAGARQEIIAFIEQLGVRNIIVEARETSDRQALQKIRKLSAGLSLQDLRVIGANVDGLAATSARKRLTPTKVLPRPQGEVPVVYGVAPAYADLAGLKVASGRFFDATDNDEATAVAVLGQAAAAALFGADNPVGQFVKVNEQWFRVIGVAGAQLAVQADLGGLPAVDRNNIIYVPLMAALLRLEDAQSWQKDEIDGIYLNLAGNADVNATGALVRGMLDTLHRNAGDFTVVVPAELLAEQQRTRRIFEVVMVAIASISLLVGGIGIMNIMLASVLERTREIGVRRAVGARRLDVIRQFLVETTLITTTGGALGVFLGVGLAELVGRFAGWSTIITPGSIILAFAVSVSVGLVFGVYPAMRAARLDPVQALHYE
jgi:putative ABC transport system permease protein